MVSESLRNAVSAVLIGEMLLELDLSSIWFDYLYVIFVVFHQIENGIGTATAAVFGGALPKNNNFTRIRFESCLF
jgi:hypothetical protein